MPNTKNAKRWRVVSIACLAAGIIVALGTPVPSIVLAAIGAHQFAASDALLPLLALALFILASVTALKIGPKLTARPGPTASASAQE